ncbi:MAG: hypothetical protein JWL61_3884 [Gemmatimonadetes bacterium]|nr:hypothetical protein [Gemmatimonadota bacterium]
MTLHAQTVARVIGGIAGAGLLVAGATLGYIAIIAAKRSEGVFLPAGYVAIACLVAGGMLVRLALKGL